ncbi:hypothetical protein [uncultured Ruminococcus sp.]|uniref:hypothetical protein n=1 Tax=uncultured Ruminococcus sp. TaxID=165186 RepID=UPI002634CEED|nr:hypothetical protein [uncultured Ruminococcus sp.]
MKLTKNAGAVLLAALLAAASWSCGNKNKTDSSNVTADTTAASGVTTEAQTTSAEDTSAAETTSAPDGSTVTTSAETVTSDTAAATTTAAATEAPQTPTKAVKKGFDSSYEAAKAYYNAYLTNNADAVYDMLCDEEIEAYHAYLRSTDLLEGKNPQVVFKRSNVINAIKQSIQAIHDIMKEKSDVPPEKWTVSLTEELLRETGENELKDFNKTLNTEFSAAADCGYVYYKDGNDDHSFIGNGCAFVEHDGKWYLSYTTIMNAELITYLDIY